MDARLNRLCTTWKRASKRLKGSRKAGRPGKWRVEADSPCAARFSVRFIWYAAPLTFGNSAESPIPRCARDSVVRSCARFACKLFLSAWSSACASVNPVGVAAVCAYAPTARSSVGRKFKNDRVFEHFAYPCQQEQRNPVARLCGRGMKDLQVYCR